MVASNVMNYCQLSSQFLLLILGLQLLGLFFPLLASGIFDHLLVLLHLVVIDACLDCNPGSIYDVHSYKCANNQKEERLDIFLDVLTISLVSANRK